MAAQIASTSGEKLKPEITVFMLVKTTTEWLGFTVDQRFKHLGDTVQPILQKYKGKVRLRFYDTEFYSEPGHRHVGVGGVLPCGLSVAGRGAARNAVLGPLSSRSSRSCPASRTLTRRTTAGRRSTS